MLTRAGKSQAPRRATKPLGSPKPTVCDFRSQSTTLDTLAGSKRRRAGESVRLAPLDTRANAGSTLLSMFTSCAVRAIASSSDTRSSYTSFTKPEYWLTTFCAPLAPFLGVTIAREERVYERQYVYMNPIQR